MKTNKIIKKRRSYTDEEKYTAMRLLKENNFDFRKTSLQTGLNDRTLRNWAQLTKDNIENALPVVQAAARTEQALGDMSIAYIRKNYNSLDSLTGLIVNKMTELIPLETDLNKLNGTLKILVDFLGKLQDTKRDDGTPTGSVVNLIQQSITQLNLINDSNKLDEDK